MQRSESIRRKLLEALRVAEPGAGRLQLLLFPLTKCSGINFVDFVAQQDRFALPLATFYLELVDIATDSAQ